MVSIVATLIAVLIIVGLFLLTVIIMAGLMKLFLQFFGDTETSLGECFLFCFIVALINFFLVFI